VGKEQPLTLSGPKGSSKSGHVFVLTSRLYSLIIKQSLIMNSTHLNLARKWRSKNFDQIVGQELSVRMLKNSLYLERYFPVYLFSGQRGCGKTTTARVFAAAINCENLAQFRKTPKSHPVPCLACASCQAMLAGKHPDFIEIDAASHTGVDNVRQIVSASQLLPLMGKKKIYLIDEAHMLSKAAFNAFLKILEEPPSSVLFILATTDVDKIIDTVKSRCFQLFFKPVSQDPLQAHLQNICKQENITYEDAALRLIIEETEGSVRDALNVLEQVRFARGTVSKDAVLHVLGHVDDERMLELVRVVLNKKPQDLLLFLQTLKFNLFSADYFWDRFAQLVRAALWLKHGVEPEWCVQHVQALKEVTASCSIKRLHNVLHLLYKNERVFLKTTAKHSLLEMILLQICQKNVGPFGDTGPSSACLQASSPAGQADDKKDEDEQDIIEEEEEIIEEEEEASGPKKLWKQFLEASKELNDPLLSSIFCNGLSCEKKDDGRLVVQFAKRFAFFKETLEETEKLWLPLLKKSFGQDIKFVPEFTGESKEEPVVEQPIKVFDPSHPSSSSTARAVSNFAGQASSARKKAAQAPKTNFRSNGYGARKPVAQASGPKTKSIDVSDAAVWKKSQLIRKFFSGTVSELIEA